MTAGSIESHTSYKSCNLRSEIAVVGPNSDGGKFLDCGGMETWVKSSLSTSSAMASRKRICKVSCKEGSYYRVLKWRDDTV